MGFFSMGVPDASPSYTQTDILLVLKRKDIEAGVLDGPDKGRESKK